MKRSVSPFAQPSFETRSRRLKLLRICLGFGLGTCLSASPVLAQTNWSFSTSGFWSDETKWSTSIVPDDPGEDVLIEQPGAYIVTLDDTRSVNRLSINAPNATFSHTSGVLSITDRIDVVAGRYELAGGTITGGMLEGNSLAYASGTLDGVAVTGGLTLAESFGQVELLGGTTIAGDINVENDSTLYINQSLDLSGQTVTLGDAGGGSSGGMWIYPAAVVNVDNSSSLKLNAGYVYLGGDLVNDGTVLADQPISSFLLDNGGRFTNTGTVTSTGGAWLNIASSDTSNTGMMSATGGSTLQLGGLWSNVGGILSVDETSLLSLGGTFDTSNLGTVSVAPGGIVEIKGSQMNAGSLFVADAGWRLAGGTITGGMLEGNSLAYASGTLDGVAVTGGLTLAESFGQVELLGGTTIAGDINVENDSTLYINQSLDLSGQTVTLGDAGGGSTGSLYAYGDTNVLAFDFESNLIGNGTVISSGDGIFFDGLISPGFGIGTIGLAGEAEFFLGSTSQIEIELGGENFGEFDMITAERFTLGGVLNVSLVNGFELAEGMSFDFLTVNDPASGSGMFVGLDHLDTVARFGGFDLKIAYGSGNGNDVRLFSVIAAVPEPSSAVMLSIGSILMMGYRRRRQPRAFA